MKSKALKVAVMGLFFAIAIVLSFIESLIPPLLPVPGIKIGLSNIVVMYCLFYMGSGYAFFLAVLKSGFVLLTRGATAAALSIGGGVFSIAAMLLAYKCLKSSCLFTSIAGGVFHNIGQLIVASILLNTVLYFYLPVLVIAGIIVGFLTGKLLQIILPVLENRVGRKE